MSDLQEENEQLKARISELTQGDPCWYGLSVADAFKMWKRDREELARLYAAIATNLNTHVEVVEQMRERERQLREENDRLSLELAQCRAAVTEQAGAPRCECSTWCRVDLTEEEFKAKHHPRCPHYRNVGIEVKEQPR